MRPLCGQGFAVLTAILLCPGMVAQAPAKALDSVTHSATMTFVRKDGTCIRGLISKTDAITITVQPFRQTPVILDWASLLQVYQGDALVYSARSSWQDVVDTHPYHREAFRLTLKDARTFKGSPVKVMADSITLKTGFRTIVLAKSEITTVDYLRLKPETDGFDLFLEEAPYVLLFDPESYYRALGLEGRLAVRLYDASKPEDTGAAGIKVCRPSD